MNSRAKGSVGESIAARYLAGRGYEVIALNYRTQAGEIDIIAQGDGMLVFVEVKARRNVEYGYPAEAVGSPKQQRIRDVASMYIAQKEFTGPVRFDVIELYMGDMKLRHIRNAF